MADIEINFETAKVAIKLIQGFCDQYEKCADCPFSKPVAVPSLDTAHSIDAYIIDKCKLGNPCEWDNVED